MKKTLKNTFFNVFSCILMFVMCLKSFHENAEFDLLRPDLVEMCSRAIVDRQQTLKNMKKTLKNKFFNVFFMFFNVCYVLKKKRDRHTPRDDPFLSPLYADLRGLPPCFVMTGESEMLRDSVLAFSSRLKEANVKVK